MDTAELLKKVRKIEIKTKGISNHIFAGEYHSAFKGRGMSFSEVRNYQYGDDVRNIDWNVTARYSEPYVKVFEEERELTVMLLVDTSASSLFGTKGMIRKEMITEISAVLSFSALKNSDKVGVIFFSDEIELFIPPKKGKKHILRIIRELIECKAKSKKTDLALALKYFNNIIKKRSTCFILSDFISAEYENALKIAARKHDVIGINVFDKFEKELPEVGLIKFADAETGADIWINTDNDSTRKKYTERFNQRQENFTNTFSKAGSDTVNIQTDESYIKELLKFFKRR